MLIKRIFGDFESHEMLPKSMLKKNETLKVHNFLQTQFLKSTLSDTKN